MTTQQSTFVVASPAPGWTAVGGGTLCLVLLILLHVVEPEFAPSWRFVSEYSSGVFGWVMQLGFLALAIAYLGVFFAVRGAVRGIGSTTGLVFLLLAVLGMGMAAFFNMDPVTISPDQATAAGGLHALASIIGVPSVPIAAMLVSINLGHRPGWSSGRRPLLWAANFTWISLVLMIGTIAILLPQQGGFGPGVLLGWPNRLLMLAYCAWAMVAGWQAIRLAR